MSDPDLRTWTMNRTESMLTLSLLFLWHWLEGTSLTYLYSRRMRTINKYKILFFSYRISMIIICHGSATKLVVCMEIPIEVMYAIQNGTEEVLEIAVMPEKRFLFY